jgi:hypothetical protein
MHARPNLRRPSQDLCRLSHRANNPATRRSAARYTQLLRNQQRALQILKRFPDLPVELRDEVTSLMEANLRGLQTLLAGDMVMDDPSYNALVRDEYVHQVFPKAMALVTEQKYMEFDWFSVDSKIADKKKASNTAETTKQANPHVQSPVLFSPPPPMQPHLHHPWPHYGGAPHMAHAAAHPPADGNYNRAKRGRV